MEGKTSISSRHKELADKLKGSLSYGQHYAYLLDWYANDRNGWLSQVPQAPKPAEKAPIVDEHVKATLTDVLESLQHLDEKIEKVRSDHRKTLLSRPSVKANAARPGRRGNIFTRLVDGRRFDRLNQ